MIICPGRKFIYIKNMKVASTSMEIWLSQLCDDDSIITCIAQEDEEIRHQLGFRGPQNYEIPWHRYTIKDWGRSILKKRKPRPFKHHDSMGRILRYYNNYSNFFSFCFERNPWDKVVSHYYYWLYQKGAEPDELSLSEFIESATHRISNWDRYTNEKDEIIVDHVAKFENLEDELEMICRKIGVSREDMGTLPRAKTRFRKSKKPYQQLLTDQQAERIQQLCHREISHFGYTFDKAVKTSMRSNVVSI